MGQLDKALSTALRKKYAINKNLTLARDVVTLDIIPKSRKC